MRLTIDEKFFERWKNKNYVLDSENCLKKEIDYIIKNLNKIQKNT